MAQGSARNPAADYPSKPISVLITYVAGSSTDGEARLYTDKMRESMGQSADCEGLSSIQTERRL